MADYWKSQAKKFCTFCKCWIADNKPSIEFHEVGSRHKENVAKRIAEISKKSREEYNNSRTIESEMKKMEEAALQAYLKDVEAEADYTSKIIKEKAMQRNIEEGSTSEEKKLADIASKVKESVAADETEKKEMKVHKGWWEAKSDEGHTYYWNTESGESVWEPPEDGYFSLKQQEEETKKVEKAAKRKKAEEEFKKKEEGKQRSDEIRARIQREKMKEVYGSKEKEEVKEKVKEEPKISPAIGPAPRVDPYGSWKVIEKKQFKPLDLQLPEQEFVPIKVPTLTEEPKVKFKEKTVVTGTIVRDDDDEVSVSGFKKRKAAPGVKKNMRQRLDED